MNSELIGIIDDYNDFDEEGRIFLRQLKEANFVYPHEISEKIENFLLYHGFRFNGSSKLSFNAAGKNFGTFDKKFLEEIPDWNSRFQIRNRILDPAILCVDWKNDSSLPNLTQCKERIGIFEEVSHNAIEDAWDVIQILRKFYTK
jgi:hypothetical protein